MAVVALGLPCRPSIRCPHADGLQRAEAALLAATAGGVPPVSQEAG